ASKQRCRRAGIYKLAKTAMQSGAAKTKEWVLDYEPEQPRLIEPLMGWTSSGDMRQQVQLRFDTAAEAIAYCERHGIAYQIFKSKPAERRGRSYPDTFPGHPPHPRPRPGLGNACPTKPAAPY